MSYITLRKAFHNPKIDAEALYQERFSNAKTIHIDIDIEGHQAFCFMDEGIYVRMLSIAKADKKVLELVTDLPGRALQQFTERTLIDEIVLTNGIEGVNSSRKEIGSILRNLEGQNRRKRFYGLVNKYNMLLQKTDIPIGALEDIRKIYDDLVLNEVVSDRPGNVPDGRLFRKESVSVYNAAGIEIHQGVYPELKIEDCLTSSLAFLEYENIELPIRVAIFHYLLGFIHPFYDGNGRLNRFISSALLLREYEPLVGLRLSYAITQSIDRYYQEFTTCNSVLNRGDLTPFVLMFLDVIKEAVDDIVEALSEKRELLGINYRRLYQVEEIVEDRNLYDLACLLVQARMFSGDGISIHELLEVTGVSRPTIMKRLECILKTGLLEREKVGREVHYQLNLEALAQKTKQGAFERVPVNKD